MTHQPKLDLAGAEMLERKAMNARGTVKAALLATARHLRARAAMEERNA